MRQLLLLLALVGCSITDDSVECPEPGKSLPDYNRNDWGRWLDFDGDCQDTRQEVLIYSSEVEVTFEDKNQCRVASGRWTDPLTRVVIVEPSKVDIDHTVPLKEAHLSGGYGWDEGTKSRYFNDLNLYEKSLQATSRSGNRSKGSRGPEDWMPPNEAYRCQYVLDWFWVKKRWGLSMDPREKDTINYYLVLCAEGEIPLLPQG